MRLLVILIAVVLIVAGGVGYYFYLSRDEVLRDKTSLLFGAISFAQDNDLPSPGLTPDSPFYFLKTWKESIQTFFAFGAENKAKQFLRLSEMRLAEYQKIVEKGETEIAQRTLEKYGKQLNQALEKAEKAKEKGKDVEKLKEAISEKIIKHQEVLISVLEKVPEQARKGIENAIEMSQKGFEKAIQAVSGEKKEKLERKAEEIKVKVETVDWNVYQDGHGFEFKYPDGFHVDTKSTKISDLPEKTEMGLGLAEALNEQDLIYNSDIDDDCAIIGVSVPQRAKSYCKIKQFGQAKGKLEKYYVGEDPSFGIKFVFYKNEARISLSAYQGLPELHQLDYENRILKFNEYFDSIIARDSSNPDLAYYDTFQKILSTFKFIK